MFAAQQMFANRKEFFMASTPMPTAKTWRRGLYAAFAACAVGTAGVRSRAPWWPAFTSDVRAARHRGLALSWGLRLLING